MSHSIAANFHKYLFFRPISEPQHLLQSTPRKQKLDEFNNIEY